MIHCDQGSQNHTDSSETQSTAPPRFGMGTVSNKLPGGADVDCWGTLRITALVPPPKGSFHSFPPESASDGKTQACINHMTWLPIGSVYLEEKEKC